MILKLGGACVIFCRELLLNAMCVRNARFCGGYVLYGPPGFQLRVCTGDCTAGCGQTGFEAGAGSLHLTPTWELHGSDGFFNRQLRRSGKPFQLLKQHCAAEASNLEDLTLGAIVAKMARIPTKETSTAKSWITGCPEAGGECKEGHR